MPLSEERAALLQILFRAKPELRNALLKHADKKLVSSLCECCLNILEGNVTINNKQKKKLSKHKILLRKIVKRTGSWESKKKLLQRGGNILIPLLAQVIGAILSRML